MITNQKVKETKSIDKNSWEGITDNQVYDTLCLLVDKGILPKKYTTKSSVDVFEPPCVRIAYAYIDAQNFTKKIANPYFPCKAYIEQWAGRYIDHSSTLVAMHLHPKAKYNIRYENRRYLPHSNPPYYSNLSKVKILPSTERLAGIEEAFTEGYSMSDKSIDRVYTQLEKITDNGMPLLLPISTYFKDKKEG